MIYLNNAATSWPKPEAVYRAADQALRQLTGSPGRGAHEGALTGGRILLETRELLAALFGVKEPEKIVFTANATEALNLALLGTLRPGDHVITSSLEHNSVARPLAALRAQGVEVTVVRCSPEGALDPAQVEEAVRPNTRLICLTHASNVTGALLPVEEIGALAKKHGLLFLVDAAQTAGEVPIDVEAAGIDLLAFTGHKGLFGPPGTGGLYVRHPERLRPLKYGGTGSASESLDQPELVPDKFESGTTNLPGIAALGAGASFVLQTGLKAIQDHTRELTGWLLEGLKAIPGITLYGPPGVNRRIPVISLNLQGISAGEAAAWLAANYNLVARSGLHCAPLAHQTLGTLATGTLRLSPGYFNTKEEIETALAALQELAQQARRRTR
ncbi:MAG: aminotransferase class V-fold PLP-dependent enzyme [Moorellales bacterium]